MDEWPSFSTEEWEEAVIAFFATLFAHDPDFIVVPEVIPLGYISELKLT